jgi:hypothetical protein
VDDTSPLLTELRDRQRRLTRALDEIDQMAVDSEEHDRATGGISPLLREVVTGRDAIPLHRRQVLHDRYAPRIRWVGVGLTVVATLALVAVLAGRTDPWLVLMVLPLLALGGWLAIRTAGDRDGTDAGTPRDRFTAGVVGLAAIVLVLATGLVSGWFLVGAVPAALVAVALSTLTGPAPDLSSGEVLDA